MKTKKKNVKIEKRLTLQGVTDVARRVGCTREHLSRVLHGHRTANDELRRRLERLRITTTVDGEPI